MKIKIFYMDDKHLDVEIEKKDSEKFFNNLGNRQFYYDETKKCGFWTDIEKIRHITVTEDELEDSETKVERIDALGEKSAEDEQKTSGRAEGEPE